MTQPAPSEAPANNEPHPPVSLSVNSPAPLLDPPLSVHVLWSPECNGENHPCTQAARSLFEFLSHIPGNELDLEEGVGIPVFAGNHFAQIQKKAEEIAQSPPKLTGSSSSLVIVPLLHSGAKVDSDFQAWVNWLSEQDFSQSGGRIAVIPVVLSENCAQVWPASVSPSESALQTAPENTGDAVAWDVGVRICRQLMSLHRLEDVVEPLSEKVNIFISYSRRDLIITDEIAQKIHNHFSQGNVQAIFSTYDLTEHRGEDVISGLQKNALTLVLRTDSYASDPACQNELLNAKRFGMPIVTLNLLDLREPRALAYGGNTITLAGVRPGLIGEKEGTGVELETLMNICQKVSLQAWLRHLHFHLDGKEIFRRRALEVEPSYLSRAPELLDFAQGPLDGSESTLLLYPDPPLPVSETDLIRRAYPRVRFATPTTLSQEALRRMPAPPLVGLQVALSLSESPSELAPAIQDFDADLAGCQETGIYMAHLNAAVAYLTLTLVRAGAQLGYGGHLKRGEDFGYTEMLADLVSAHRRTRGSDRSKLLHSYLAAFLWEQRSEELANKIDAEFYRIPKIGTAATDMVGRALELYQMRQQMAVGGATEDTDKDKTTKNSTDARVILGGRTLPKQVAPNGYIGRLPGQAEEAMRHLLAGKPIYVIGGFYGASKLVADALCNQLDHLPKEGPLCEQSPEYQEFCGEFDQRLPESDPIPRTLDDLWEKFAAYGQGVFWGETPAEGSKWIPNGLTPEENKRLLRTTQKDEISALVLKGLQFVAQQESAKESAPLKVALFNGSITDVLDVEAYGILVLSSAKLRGADGALDERLQGAIHRRLETKTPERIISVKSERLTGDYVLLNLLGELDDMVNTNPEALQAKVEDGIRQIIQKAGNHRIRSIALVLSGVNLGLTVKQSLDAIFNAVLQTRAKAQLESIAICELDQERYQSVSDLAHQYAETGNITVTQLPPKIPRDIRAPLFLNFQSKPFTASPAGSTTLRLGQFARGPGGAAAVGNDEMTVEMLKLRDLTDPNRDAHWPYKDNPPTFDKHDEIGQQLADLVLSDSVKQEILKNRSRAWDILHDVQSSIIPFEMLALEVPETGELFRPALEHGMRRGLLIGDQPVPEPYVTRLPLRLLLVADPTNDLPATRTEAEGIINYLSEIDEVEVTPLIGPGEATLARALEELQTGSYDFVHYAGHGNFDHHRPEKTGLIFDGKEVLTAERMDDLNLDQPPMLIILNACEAAVIEDTDAGASLAQRILCSGVRGFLSNRWTVGDAAAATFASSIYASLAQGRPLGGSVLQARKLLYDQGEQDWINYTFYGSPEIRL